MPKIGPISARPCRELDLSFGSVKKHDSKNQGRKNFVTGMIKILYTCKNHLYLYKLAKIEPDI